MTARRPRITGPTQLLKTQKLHDLHKGETTNNSFSHIPRERFKETLDAGWETA